MAHISFDASTVSPHKDQFEPIPAGWYHATIVGSELTFGKSPDAGEMLKLQIEINGNEHPSYASRRVFTYLCIYHKKEATRNIAKRQLSAICHAIETLELEDTDELLGASLMVRLKIRPARDGYDASNDVAGYSAPGAEKTTEAPSAQPSSTDNNPSGLESRGWK